MSETSQNKPLVTVVIPCYNYANMVGRAIQSVKDQVLTNFECFVVDNNSTDNSAEVIKEAIKDDARFTYLNCPDQGVAHARNMGVFAGSAPFVMCLDADDQVAPEFLEVCVSALEEDPSIGISYTGLWYIKPDGKEGLSSWPGEFNYDDALRGLNQIPTCNVSRREIWERLGGQRQRYAIDGAGEEDAEMWLRAGALGWRGKKVTDAGFFKYSWMSGRVSGNKEHQMTDYRAWHPWTKDGKHPFASQAKAERISHPVRQYDEPVISVIIPVGPGHEKRVIDSLDSLEAQTFRKWEAIVVWDNPEDTKFVETAFPFIRLVKLSNNHGAGYARNRGAEIARADLLLFLDADDYLMSEALQITIDEYANERKIIYSDYIGMAFIDQNLRKKLDNRLISYRESDGWAVIRYNSFDYDCARAVRQPEFDDRGNTYVWNLITSLVPKKWHDEVGGFDETMPSWEDWDYWIRLAKAGKCFLRINQPLIVYHFYTGNRRETGLQSHPDLIKYMRSKYEGIDTMPCSSCGKKINEAAGISSPPMSVSTINSLNDQDFVLVLYDHPNKGAHRVIGAQTGRDYGYRSGGDRFLAHKADIAAQPRVYIPIRTVIQEPENGNLPDLPPPVPLDGILEEVSTEAEKPAELDKQSKDFKAFDMQTIPGITSSIASELEAAGVLSLDDLLQYGVNNLQRHKGIGEARAEAIIKFATERMQPKKP